ncbi:MAG: hypothetical protein ACJAS6_001072 [Rickettsiales bacterium]|jgi:hypothetical protein
MDGHDLMRVLEGGISFDDCLRSKIDAFIRKGEIFSKNF